MRSDDIEKVNQLVRIEHADFSVANFARDGMKKILAIRLALFCIAGPVETF